MEQKYKIYCDMDGVLVDFTKGYYELTGTDMTGNFRDDDAFWQPIIKAGYDFWINLPWMEDGKKLWSHIKKYNPEILSAPSKQNESRVAKNDWIKKELPGVHLILRSMEHKKDFATPTSILIDDLKSNIDSWVGAGGIGILHKNADDTIKQLKKYKL